MCLWAWFDQCGSKEGGTTPVVLPKGGGPTTGGASGGGGGGRCIAGSAFLTQKGLIPVCSGDPAAHPTPTPFWRPWGVRARNTKKNRTKMTKTKHSERNNSVMGGPGGIFGGWDGGWGGGEGETSFGQSFKRRK